MAPHSPISARVRWPWLWWAGPLSWVLGVALQLQQPRLWSTQTYACLSALALVLIGLFAAIVVVSPRPHQPSNPALTPASLPGGAHGYPLLGGWLCVALVLLGAASTGWRAGLRQQQVLAPAWEGRTWVVSGQVVDLPRATPSGWRLVVALDGTPPLAASPPPATPPHGWPQRVALSWSASEPGGLPRAGERWQLPVRLRAPHGTQNPSGFDSELWMWSQGLGASGSVRLGPREPPAQRLAEAPWGLLALRDHLRTRLAAQVPDAPAAGVLAALVVGDQSAIDRAGWDVFRATGVAHLFSISGLHITLWAWLVQAAVARLWRVLPRASPVWGARVLLACPAPVAAAWGGWGLALAYAVFSGWGVPAQRTVLMLGVVLGLGLLGRRWPWPVVGAVAMAVVLAWDPWAWLQPGFWLSFVAVGVLLAGGRAPAARGWLGAARDMARTQWRMTLALAPLTLALFGQVSVVGLLANAVAIPVVTVLVTPLALAGALWPALWTLAAWVLGGLLAFLQGLAAWSWASWVLPTAPAALALAAVLGGLVVVLRAPLPLRCLGGVLVLPVLLWQPARPPVGEFEVLAADVGQGSAVLIRTATGSVLYDAGPQWGPDTDAGQRVLVPLLQSLGERPQRVVLSHRDGDHVGGALAVLAHLRGSPTATASASTSTPSTATAAVAGTSTSTSTSTSTGSGTGTLFAPSLSPPPWAQAVVAVGQLRARFAAGGAGQAVGVWASFEPPELVSGLTDPVLARTWARQPPAWTRCEAGQSWQQDGVRFELLHPAPALYEPPSGFNTNSPSPHAAKPTTANNRSCVLWVRGAQRSALLTGDMDARHEAALVATHPTLRADWLLAPHHGSHTSSSEALLRALQPRWVVVQAGHQNRYGHPAPSVLARYQALGLRWVDSPHCGAARWRSDAPDALACQRHAQPRYWHWVGGGGLGEGSPSFGAF